MNPADKVEKWAIDKLIPYARNARTHSSEQVSQLAASIKEWGWTTPVLVDETGGIIAGHGRTLAAQKLGMTEVPVMVAKGWSDAKKRAYIIADNKLAQNADWDNDMLSLELEEIDGLGFDIDLTGFTAEEITELTFLSDSDEQNDDSKYTKKIDAPVYTPSGDCPPVNELYEKTKYEELTAKIYQDPEIKSEVKDFLLAAAARHIRFDFEQIAEFYAHASPDIQQLMEDSALVIIDFDKAIANGYVKLSQSISDAYTSEKGEKHDA